MSATCEYGLVGGVCAAEVDDPDNEVFCPAHREFPWTICQGCAGTAIRECPDESMTGNGQGACKAPLCGVCRHEGAGHTNDPAPPRSGPQTTSQQVQSMQDDLVNNIESSLTYAVKNQIDVHTTAKLILESLQLHLLVTTVTGMAIAPKD